jgi:acyl-CoA reductase-like NAD-dependent aldehyde dehydrogenase
MDSTTVVGPVISRHALKTINAHIQDALAKGAVNATPQQVMEQTLPEQGNYIHPTLLTGMNPEMIMMQEETFGPVVAVCGVDSDEEAIKLMNGSKYGLTASVWTADIAKGKATIRQLEAGTVFVNRCDYPNPVSSQ